MNSSKQQYLQQIRTNTSYPTYRSIIGLLALLGYILSGLYGLGALIGGITAMGESFLLGLGVMLAGFVVAGMVFLGAKFFKEGALILADMGDSITETNATNQRDKTAD